MKHRNARKMMLPMMLTSMSLMQDAVKYPAKKTWKPVFTKEDMGTIKLAKNKKVKAEVVKKLRAKYLAAAGGIFAVNL